MADRYQARKILVGSFLLQGLAILLLLRGEGAALFWAFVILFAVGHGGALAIAPLVLNDLFGSTYLGSLVGTLAYRYRGFVSWARAGQRPQKRRGYVLSGPGGVRRIAILCRPPGRHDSRGEIPDGAALSRVFARRDRARLTLASLRLLRASGSRRHCDVIIACFCFAARHPQRRHPAYRAEEVARLACAPDVAREMFPWSQHAELLALDAPMEKSAPRADRAVALHSAGQLAVRPESVSSEVTSITVTNVSPPDFGAPAGVCLIHEASFVVHEVVQVPAGARQSLTEVLASGLQ